MACKENAKKELWSGRPTRLLSGWLFVAALSAVVPESKGVAAEASGLRFGRTAERVRVVIDLDRLVPFEHRLNANATMLRIRLSGVTWRGPTDRPIGNARPLTAFSTRMIGADTEVTLTASAPIAVRSSFTLAPSDRFPAHRIVVDLTRVVEAGAPQPAPAPAEADIVAMSEPTPAESEELFLARGAAALTPPDGRAPDAAAAMEWFKQAVALGSVRAAFNMAEMFRVGLGVPQSFTLAAEWYERAAGEDFAPAQFYLAALLFRGLGVDQDEARATGLLRRAAELGHQRAQQALQELGQTPASAPAAAPALE